MYVCSSIKLKGDPERAAPYNNVRVDALLSLPRFAVRLKPGGPVRAVAEGLILAVSAAAQRDELVINAVLVSLCVNDFEAALYHVRAVGAGSDSYVCHYEKTSGLVMCSGCRFRLLIRPNVA